jgi:hypothetical protein
MSERTRLSFHARQRADEMGVDHHVAIRAAKHPQMRWPANPIKYPNCEMCRLDDIVVAVAADGRTIITVLWWAPDAPFHRQEAC